MKNYITVPSSLTLITNGLLILFLSASIFFISLPANNAIADDYYESCWVEKFVWDPSVRGERAVFNRLGNSRDLDLDYVNDDFEFEVANYFKPYISCHSTDESCYSGVDGAEPVTIYQVTPIDFSDDGYDFSPIISAPRRSKIYIVITYVFLWTNDPGYGPPPYSVPPTYYHPGDSGCAWYVPGHGGHYADNMYVRIFLSSAPSNTSTEWQVIGVEHDGSDIDIREKRMDRDHLDHCFPWTERSAITEEEGCHFTTYWSHGKKHLYSSITLGCIEEDSCTGDWSPSFPIDGC